jgi:hypothetical protein
MYGYTLHVPAPIDAYRAMHEAVLAVLEEEGGGEGLVVHIAYPTDEGFDLTELFAPPGMSSSNSSIALVGVRMSGLRSVVNDEARRPRRPAWP